MLQCMVGFDFVHVFCRELQLIWGGVLQVFVLFPSFKHFRILNIAALAGTTSELDISGHMQYLHHTDVEYDVRVVVLHVQSY